MCAFNIMFMFTTHGCMTTPRFPLTDLGSQTSQTIRDSLFKPCCVFTNFAPHETFLYRSFSGERLNFWLYDTVSLPTLLLVLVIVLHCGCFAVARQAFCLYGGPLPSWALILIVE